MIRTLCLSIKDGEGSASATCKLWVQKTKQLLLIALTKRCPHAHVPHHRAGNAWRKALGGRMASRALLLEHALTFIRMAGVARGPLRIDLCRRSC